MARRITALALMAVGVLAAVAGATLVAGVGAGLIVAGALFIGLSMLLGWNV